MRPKRLLAQLGPVALLLAPLLLPTVFADSQTKVVFATGQEGGTYRRLGQALAEAAADSIEVEVVGSNGSVHNIRLLAAGKADLALVQGDIAHQAVRGHKPFQERLDNLVVVTPLYTEAVQLLIRSHLYVFTTAGLKGKNVSLGREGSGTYHTARAVIEASGLSLEELKVKPLALKEINQHLKDETIDAVFRSSAVPTPSAKEELRDIEARLIPLENIVIERLVRSGIYVETSVPGHTYPNQVADVPTVGVRALLMARADADAIVVKRLIEILRDERAAIEDAIDIRLDILLERRGVQGLRVAVHPSANAYLREVGSPWVSIATILLAFLAVVILIVRKRGGIHRSLEHQRNLFIVFFMFIFVWLLGSAGLYIFERHVNESFNSFLKSAWSMVVYVAGGFQTRMPITPGGEVVTVFSVVFGAALVTAFAGIVIGGFTAKVIKRRRSMPKDMREHIVIVNWDERAKEMIQELHGANFKDKKPIVVISEKGVEFPDSDEFEDVAQEVGNPARKPTLKRARVEHAHSITILSPRGSDDRSENVDDDVADTKTIVTILAIRQVCAEGKEPAVPITAEIRARRNCDAASNAGQGGYIEIVCAEDFGADILTQCAYTPGLAHVYKLLVTFKRETSEVYKWPLPKDCKRKTFGEILKIYADTRSKTSEPAIPIGVYRDSKLYLNPRDDVEKLGELKDGDDLLVISYGKR
ncbi:MAG: TAXI family TRAP transporter solute-binding subunit [Terriglobia bacterium]